MLTHLWGGKIGPAKRRPCYIDVDGRGREVIYEQRKLVRAMVPLRKSVWTSWWLMLVTVLVFFSGPSARAQVDERKAALVKASFVCKVPEYTRWPAGALDDAPLTVGVLGADPHGVGRVIERSISQAGFKVAGRRVALRRMSDIPKEAAARSEFEKRLLDCHVLFLTEAVHDDWPQVRELIADKPILVFGEFQTFSRTGGMIEFVVGERPDGARAIDLHVNLDAVRGAGLDLESTLLRIRYVTVVKVPQGQGRVSMFKVLLVKRGRGAAVEIRRTTET